MPAGLSDLFLASSFLGCWGLAGPGCSSADPPTGTLLAWSDTWGRLPSQPSCRELLLAVQGRAVGECWQGSLVL